MGNKPSCCISGSPVGQRVKNNTSGSGKKGFARNIFEYENSLVRKEENSAANLQHISEREPEDVEEDPSTHPTKGPIFMERSKSEMKIRDNRRSFYVLDGQLATAYGSSPPFALKKSNSCSTIFLDDSTISQPNLKNTIKCISLAIYYHIANRKNRGRSIERTMEIFDEAQHPVMTDPLPPDYAVRDPEHRHIYRFIRTLFSAAQLTAECAIITLVYIERLLTYAEIDLCPTNWRRVLLGAIMMASKVWDDQAVWNVDYCQILRRCTVEDMNELERQFLECLEFNINVPSSVYAKYYFDLRTLAIANDMQLPLQPLYKERAKKLEALSKIYEDKHLDGHKKVRKRCSSAERLPQANKILVIIP